MRLKMSLRLRQLDLWDPRADVGGVLREEQLKAQLKAISSLTDQAGAGADADADTEADHTRPSRS